jgi:hypothetical protein
MKDKQFSDKHKHLEFLQGAINRMAGNLFLLKGWTVTLIAALFALAAKDTNKSFVFFAYFPLLVFWVLDGFFLSQERCFRALYDHVRQLDESKIDFSMDTRAYKSEWRNTWPGGCLSHTLLVYYVSLAVLLLVLSVVLRS